MKEIKVKTAVTLACSREYSGEKMKPVRCQNGHYYDADLYRCCPHCEKGRNGKETASCVSGREERDGAPAVEITADKKERKGGSFFSFLKSREKNAESEKNISNPAVSTGYECEPTRALSESELKNLLERDRDTHTESAGPATVGNDSAEIFTSFAINTEEDKKTAEAQSPLFRDNKCIPQNFGAPAVFECPETVGLFSSSAGEKEPCVGWLTAVSGVYRGRSFELKAGGNFIGRGPQNDIVLSDDNRVSRYRHARVAFEPRSGEFYIDVGESSGLAYINGKNILHHAELSAGDMIEIGGGCYIFIPLCSKNFSWTDFTPEGSVCRGRTDV